MSWSSAAARLASHFTHRHCSIPPARLSILTVSAGELATTTVRPHHLKAKRPGRSAACGCQAGLRGSRAGSHPSRGWQPRTGCWLPPWLPSSAQRGAWQPLGWRAASAHPRSGCHAPIVRQPRSGSRARSKLVWARGPPEFLAVPNRAPLGVSKGRTLAPSTAPRNFFCEKSVPRRAPAPKPLIDPNWCAPFLR